MARTTGDAPSMAFSALQNAGKSFFPGMVWHIERWLDITAQRFHGDEPIPRLGSRVSSNVESPASLQQPAPFEPVEKVANG